MSDVTIFILFGLFCIFIGFVFFKLLKNLVAGIVMGVLFAVSMAFSAMLFMNGSNLVLLLIVVFWLFAFVIAGVIAQGESPSVHVKKDRNSTIAKTVHCPKCKSINAEFMSNDRKAFSAGKAVAGTVLTGGVGALAGFAGKKGDNQWHCKDCGSTFATKD